LASVLSALPISPVCLLGFWVGMWSFFTLQASSVKRAFADVRRRSPPAGLAGALPGLALVLGPPLLVLAAGAGIAALTNMSSPGPIGTIMVYDVQMGSRREGPLTDWKDAIAFCEARVNNGRRKVAQVKMQQAMHYETQATRIEIGVYGDDPLVANRIEERLAAKGKIEFAILADSEKDAALIARAQAIPGTDVPAENAKPENDGSPLPAVARWVRVSHRTERSLQDAFGAYRDFVTRRKTAEGLEILVLVDPLNVTEKEISRARVESSRDTSGVQVDIALNSEGARKMRSLTSRPEYLYTAFKTRRLGVVVDDVLLTAPHLRDVLADRLQISGDFSLDEANDFVSLVRAGKAPESIKQVSRKTIAE
jgi:preprotein translocase subunit SecD